MVGAVFGDTLKQVKKILMATNKIGMAGFVGVAGKGAEKKSCNARFGSPFLALNSERLKLRLEGKLPLSLPAGMKQE